MTTPSFPHDAILKFEPGTDTHIYSNFPLYPVRLDGVEYPSVEHGYQAGKIVDLDARFLRVSNEGVLKMTPAQVKNWGRTFPLPTDWNSRKVDVMWGLLKQKWISPITETSLSRKLLLTGDRLLVEGNYWHDVFWGKCYCSRHQWDGENYLGRMLMRIRYILATTSEWRYRMYQAHTYSGNLVTSDDRIMRLE